MSEIAIKEDLNKTDMINPSYPGSKLQSNKKMIKMQNPIIQIKGVKDVSRFDQDDFHLNKSFENSSRGAKNFQDYSENHHDYFTKLEIKNQFGRKKMEFNLKSFADTKRSFNNRSFNNTKSSVYRNDKQSSKDERNSDIINSKKEDEKQLKKHNSVADLKKSPKK